MVERRVETSSGTLRLFGWRDEWIDWGAQVGQELASSNATLGQFVHALDRRVYVKGGPLVGRARWRHALRARLLRVEPPRLAEYMNLCWLTERLFQTPIPLVAGAFVRRGTVSHQFLATAEVAPAIDLQRFLEKREPGRQGVLDELARELARMHALHFVHRDLFARNVLVGEPCAGRRVYFLDAWRGGCRLQSRGSVYDLACFFLHAPELLSAGEQAGFFELYARERALQGRPIDAGLASRIARERTRLVRRISRDPGRLHGHTPPTLDWALPVR